MKKWKRAIRWEQRWMGNIWISSFWRLHATDKHFENLLQITKEVQYRIQARSYDHHKLHENDPKGIMSNTTDLMCILWLYHKFDTYHRLTTCAVCNNWIFYKLHVPIFFVMKGNVEWTFLFSKRPGSSHTRSSYIRMVQRFLGPKVDIRNAKP